MKKLLIAVLTVYLHSALIVMGQNTTTIPLHQDVKHGVLNNGMTYYIMHNEEPKDRASFYFAQNVGAILEEDAQNGLAHFLEHMAFNGLENFPGKNMITYFEGKGIKFGRDINAFTAQDETIYNLSNIPVANEGVLDSALLVLHDWSGGLLLEAEEIEAERGVIHEEWRTRRNAQFRLMAKSNPEVLNHSQYAKRDVIGSLDVIDNFEHKELRAYYKKWYRPDNQAVVIVGDIDVVKMEQKVKDLFSKIPMPKNAAERVYYQVEDTKQTGYVLAKDKEAKGVTINWLFRLPVETIRNESYLKESIAKKMFSSMLNTRLKELTQKPDCSALSMQVGAFSLVRTKDAAALALSPKTGQELEAFELLMTEIEKVRRHGFTQSELDRAKTSYLRNIESYLENKDKITNEGWAKQLYNHFLKAEPVPSVEWDVNFTKNVVENLSLYELKKVTKLFKNMNNSVLSVSGPDQQDINYPKKEDLLDIYHKVSETNVTAYKDEALDENLLPEELEEKSFTSVTDVKGADAKLYTLDNGAKVVIMPTELNKDQILFNAFSFGGKSLLNRSQLESGDMATALSQISGVGEFNAMQLQKKLTGKNIKLQFGISEMNEGTKGSASPKDFETLLQLIYMNFEHPRFDKDAFDAQMGKMKHFLQYAAADNKKVFEDTLSQVLNNYHERTLQFNQQFVDNIDFAEAKYIYQDRIKDAADFTFLFVGHISEDQLPLIAKYIGNISTEGRKETWKDNKVRMAEGKTQCIFERPMEVPKSTVYFNVTNDLKFNNENASYLDILGQLLTKRYLETMREEEGGTYGVQVRPMFRKIPYEHASLNIQFDCDPDKQEHLRSLIYKELELITKTVSHDDLEEIKKSFFKDREEAIKKNEYWMSVLQARYIDQSEILNDKAFTALIESISTKKMIKFAQKFLKKYDSTEVVMNPEK